MLGSAPDTNQRSSASWRNRATAVLAGKQSNFRKGMSAQPIIADRAEGVRIIDVDGKDYIDFVLGMGPAIWGHDNSEIQEAIASQTRRQFSAASAVMHTTLEIELAEKMVEHVPCAELVRFGLSGTEAVQLTMRLARGATGKRYVLRFDGHYHGWVDSVFGSRADTTNPDNFYPLINEAAGAGIAPHAIDDIMMVPWNDLLALESALQAHGDTIAMVLMEAVMCNNGCCPPRPGYLQTARKLCDKYGVLLCFDEVITGFRMHIGGAQAHFGVTPDIAIFGKALAGGLPLSAIAGKQEVMVHLATNRVLGGGTFNSFPLSMATGLATMNMLERDDFGFYRRLAHVHESIAEGLRSSAGRHGFKLLVQGPPGFLFFSFIDKEVAYAPNELADANEKLGVLLRDSLEQEGVIIAGGNRLVTTAAMADCDLEDALGRFDRAFARLRDRIETEDGH